MRKLVIESGAREDIREICRYYDQHSETAGDRFIEEVDEWLQEIRISPTRFSPISSDSSYRRVNLKIFPYQIVYGFTIKQIRIVAIRHNKRHPDSHEDRLN